MSGCRVVQFLLAWVLAWLCVLPSLAAAAPEPSFERRVWTRADGAPQSAYGMTQDADGMLWFATTTGLYNFDGAHFNRVDAVYGHPLRSNNVIVVVAAGQGIAVGYQFGGVSVFTHARARHYTTADGLPAGSIGMLAVDGAGTLHAGGTGGLAWLDPGRNRWTVPAKSAVPGGIISMMQFDASGTQWVVSNSRMYFRPKGDPAFHAAGPVPYTAQPMVVRGKLVAHTVDGKLVELSASAPPKPFRIAVPYSRDDDLFDGPRSTVWGWLRNGTTLLRPGADGMLVEAQTFEGGKLPGRMVSRTLVDREDNLWVATLGGVERYRMRRLHAVPMPETPPVLNAGRGIGDAMLVTSGNDGPVWQLAGQGVEVLPALKGVTAMCRQDAGNVWLGGTSGLFHVTPVGTRHWPVPAHIPKGFEVQGITVDGAGTVWVAIVRHGLFRFADGTWTRFDTGSVGADATPVRMFTAPSGRTWLGFTAGRVGELTPHGVRLVAADLDGQVGNVLSLLEFDGKLLVGGDRGVAWLRDGKAQLLRPEHMAAFIGTSGMGVDRTGDLWLHGSDGLFHVAAADLRRTWDDPAHRPRAEAFNFEDGLRGQVAQVRPLPSLVVAADGKVYYSTSTQVGWIDPAAIPRNARPPTVLVQALLTSAGDHGATSGMALAAGTTRVDIRFTATALSMPERVRFRYRLSSVDQEWQEPQSERAARYTNLGPGSYRFQVIAANEDGVWNDTGAVLQFSIAPTIWQTHWFRGGALLLAALAIYLLYRWRIAAVSRRSAEKTAARLEERERIARNLHDNLLQGVQGLILRCHAVLMRMPKGSAEERSLGEALARADQLVEDTRDEVMNLRNEAVLPRLVDGLRQAVEAIDPTLRDRLELRMSGCVERLHDDAAGEIFYVLQEAIANSARHSGAAAIVVSLHASERGIDGSVADNGMGIAPDIARDGRAGHWGLVGMRERMARLGGTLVVRGDAGRGTTVSFSVPAATAYQAPGGA